MKISSKIKFNKTKKVNETFLRLRIKSGEKWREYNTLYDADSKELKTLQDIASEIKYYLDKREEKPYELRRRIETELGNTKKREVFVKAKLVDPVESKDTTIAGVFKDLKERLEKRCKKGEIEDSVRFKRFTVLDKFQEYADKKLPNVRDIRDINQSHCYGFIDYLLYDRVVDGKQRTVAHTTAQSEKAWISQQFQLLVNQDILSKNPFDGVTFRVIKNDDRLITLPWGVLTEIELVLKAYNHTNFSERLNGWVIYWMLTRYLGCRKNEALQLKWKHVDFNALNGMGAVNMPSPKTKKKTGRSYRRCPMMNSTGNKFVDCELKEDLMEEFKRQNPHPEDYVVQGIMNLHKRKRDQVIWKNKNPSTQLEKLIIFCGVAPWVKLLQNLRVTRANELMKHSKWRPEAVHSIIGHTKDAYESNYANITDDDFTNVYEPEFEQLIEDPDTGLRYSPSYSPNLSTTGQAYLAKCKGNWPKTPFSS